MSTVEPSEDGSSNQDASSRPSKTRIRVNSLWSLWYGLVITAFQAYIAVRLSKRLLDCLELSWGTDNDIAVARGEVQACLVLTGIAIVLLPFFLISTFVKVGNLANDGFKMGRSCTDGLTGGGLSLWRHGGPTAPFLHIVISFCLLLPNLIIQARLIQADFLPTDYIWKTDIDFITSSYDRLVVLSFKTSMNLTENATRASQMPPLSMSSSSPPFPQSLPLTGSQEIFDEDKWGPVSVNYFNYALALSVYAVRYPAVFWNTNKYWGIIFSFQLFINGLQNLMVYVGVCVLYKVHVYGPTDILTSLPTKFGTSFFLLNPVVTLALLFLTTGLVLASSLVLYLYGYGRFQAFLSHEKACKVISVESKEWGYLTHCAALCVLLAITVVEGPLLVDLAVIYKATLDSSVLFSVVAAVFHLFIWVVLWLILTLKQNWEFKLRVTVGKAAVKSARSIKLLTDVELLSSCESTAPLLVVASGRTYTVYDTSPKKTIINAIHKATIERKNKLQGSTSRSPRDQYEDDEDIYWLRPKPISPKNSPDSEISDRVNWQKKAVPKPKVTFDRNVKSGPRDCLPLADDGDYAQLRELPMIGVNPMENNMQMVNEMIEMKERYMSSRSVMKVIGSDYEDPNPNMVPDPLISDVPLAPLATDTPTTPKCLLRADSGMPHDLTPKSESDTSGSPPDNSETSSGVHSNSSRESHCNGTAQLNQINENENRAKQNPWPPKQINPIIRPVVNGQNETGEVLIRRRVEPEPVLLPNQGQDKFSRSTNMKMTSFTDGSHSATLPHFPTQVVGGNTSPYPHCSTMPLPPPPPPPPLLHIPHLPTSYAPRHSTIPTHHNGVRLFTPSLLTKRPLLHRFPHQSFPQLMSPTKYSNLSNCNGQRDSVNFSLTSNGESEAFHS